MKKHDKNLVSRNQEKIHRLGVCWSVRLHSQTPHSNSHRRCKKQWRFLLPQICHNYGLIHWGWFLRIFCRFFLFMGWFMVISLMRFTLWYHFGFCGKLRRGCTYRTENKHVWWTKYDKLLHVQRQGQNISKPIRYWMVTKFTAWYFVHQPTCHGPSGASTLLVLRGRPVRLQTWNGILEPSTEVDCSHLSLTVTMYNMCKRKAKKKTSNYFEQTNTCTVVRFSRYAQYVFRSW